MSTLLVIEDDLPNRLLLSLQLEDLDCEVVTADNGIRGLERISANHPDAIILDLNMPEMDGFTFLKSLRSRQDGNIPVVVVTAMFLDKSHCDLLREYGVVKILEKGRYDEDDLLSCLKDVLKEA